MESLSVSESKNVDIIAQTESKTGLLGEDQSLSEEQHQNLHDVEAPMAISGSGSGSQIPDRLAEKFLDRIADSEDQFYDIDPNESQGKDKARRFLSLQLMSSNFRQFSTRIGAIFSLQRKLKKLIAWSSYTQTTSFLAMYTLICLEPHLISVLPLVFTLLLLTNSYSTHNPSISIPAHRSENLISDEPNLFVPSVKPIKERSKDFFRNMRDIQNVMEDYSKFYDQITESITPLVNFSNEELSCSIFFFIFLASFFALSITHLIPWRLVMLLLGWIIICANHPFVSRISLVASRHFVNHKKDKLNSFLNKLIAMNKLSAPSEILEVEIFEIQLLSSAGEWVPFLYSRSPFLSSFGTDKGSEWPKGTHFMEDVRPPHGWEWTERKWTLDFLSYEWVQERVITGVEVEIEGERWVYDLRCEADMIETNDDKGKQILSLTWEEEINNPTNLEKRRGPWRRRRWVRTVKQIWPKDIPTI
ncbi:Peroxisomal membrane protein PEX29 [Erysiphe necator]|nr:Peroxisomal membrane protein PEX29 [Erysiphe necator]